MNRGKNNGGLCPIVLLIDNIPESSVVVTLVRLILQEDTEGDVGRERRDEHRMMKV